ncbi:protein serine/threonine phosphatase 2C [Annulohypoxylon maeteangense]|uniref:protein serine/threonine phosphatase 2C n=1 Tax=Annulohypoxylon maeteangense TaxID=1927788 RepID=UPI0020087C03|nr:protein serine/threonine phosphatase 2C [Annulohypoxylon maeteangense]KAI0890512.1 protein serine/threonine phosphatase 2C [Annulohypoxylon maeteangense]
MLSKTHNGVPLRHLIPCFQSQLRSSLRLTPASPQLYHHMRTFSVQSILRSKDPQPQTEPTRRFVYHAAAAFSTKFKRFDPYAHVFHFNPYNRIQTHKRPKSKRPASGQDAFFITRVGDTNTVAFGIADGVGGWEDAGVDPADFSHGFCEYMASAAYEHKPVSSEALLTAKSLMQRGYDDVCRDNSINAGGSTASVAIANEDGKLEVANLGDSGFVHIRLNAVHYYSEPQTHAFNTPFQLAIVPASMLARAAAFGGAQLCDYPKDADVTQHTLKHGDILIFASDGLWDNLFNQDILRIVSRLMVRLGAWVPSKKRGILVADDIKHTQDDPSIRPPLTLQSALAVEIAGAAKLASVNEEVDGPFAKEVQKYYPRENWHGGKIDDICVIAIVVSEDGKSEMIKSKL